MSKKKLYGWGHMHQPASYKSADMADSINKRLDELDAIYGSTVSKIRAIEGNGEFTVKGKQNARAALAVEVKSLIRDWRIVEENLADQIRQVEESMTPKRNRPDDSVAEMRQREIRDVLRTLDPIEVEEKYMSAARAGDDLFLQAIEESPFPFSFATKGLIQKVRFSRLEKVYPEEALKLADLRTGETNIESALQSVQADLAKQGLDIKPESL